MPDVEYVVIADAAAVVSGRLSLLNAGALIFPVSDFPVRMLTLGIAIFARVQQHELPSTGAWMVDIVDAANQSISVDGNPMATGQWTVERMPLAPPGLEQLLTIGFTIPALIFHKPGPYSVVVHLDGTARKRLTFHLVATPKAANQRPL